MLEIDTIIHKFCQSVVHKILGKLEIIGIRFYKNNTGCVIFLTSAEKEDCKSIWLLLKVLNSRYRISSFKTLGTLIEI